MWTSSPLLGIYSREWNEDTGKIRNKNTQSHRRIQLFHSKVWRELHITRHIYIEPTGGKAGAYLTLFIRSTPPVPTVGTVGEEKAFQPVV
jgi:hypothetical protein